MGNSNPRPSTHRAPRTPFLTIATAVLAFSTRESFTFKTTSQRVTTYYFHEIDTTKIYNYAIGDYKSHFLIDSFPLNTYL